MFEVVREGAAALVDVEGILEFEAIRELDMVAERPIGRTGATVVGRDGPERVADSVVVGLEGFVIDAGGAAGRNCWKGSSSSLRSGNLGLSQSNAPVDSSSSSALMSRSMGRLAYFRSNVSSMGSVRAADIKAFPRVL